MNQPFQQHIRDFLLFTAGLIFLGSALIWWTIRYRCHPEILLITTDGYGGSPCVSYLPPRRNQVHILLPGSSYAAGLMLQTLQQKGEQRIQTIFCPTISEQLRGLERFFQKNPPAHIVMIPAARSRSSWKIWLSRASFNGIFIQTAPAAVVGWQLQFNANAVREHKWKFQTGNNMFHLWKQRSGSLMIQLQSGTGPIRTEEIRRSNRPEIKIIPLQNQNTRPENTINSPAKWTAASDTQSK